MEAATSWTVKFFMGARSLRRSLKELDPVLPRLVPINADGFRNVWLVGNPEVCHPNEAGKTFRSCVVSVLPVTRQSIGCPRLPDR
jgi:hypothetical protein